MQFDRTSGSDSEIDMNAFETDSKFNFGWGSKTLLRFWYRHDIVGGTSRNFLTKLSYR